MSDKAVRRSTSLASLYHDFEVELEGYPWHIWVSTRPGIGRLRIIKLELSVPTNRFGELEGTLGYEDVRAFPWRRVKNAVQRAIYWDVLTSEGWWRTPPPARLPGRAFEDSHFVFVARVYKACLNRGVWAIPLLAETFDTTIQSVSRWVSECRRRELLPRKVVT